MKCLDLRKYVPIIREFQHAQRDILLVTVHIFYLERMHVVHH